MPDENHNHHPAGHWELVCTTPDCPLIDLLYYVESDPAECGGCNTVYPKPAE